MRLFRLPAAFALVLALSAVPAAAQTASPVVEAGAWSATPFLSLTFGGNGETSSLGLGGAAGYDLTDLFSIEGEVAFVFDLVGDNDGVDWSVMSLGGNVLYHFPLANGMAPYATAGLGIARSSFSISGFEGATLDDAATEVGFNFGGGLKAPLTDTLAARGDIRYFKYIDEGPDGWRVYGGLTWKPRR
ncbi:MAG TPA: porin family protein [Vicinamibacterales bacterium]|nr:porin family protein [Vicinamibacterales bacterium]